MSRLGLLRIGFLLAGIVILGQLFRVQVLSHGFYAALAEGQHDLFRKLFPARGKIYVRDAQSGEHEYLLATNRSLSLLYAEPYNIDDPRAAARQLAPFLEMKPEELEPKLSSKEERYRPLKRQVTDDVRERIEALQIKGIRFSDEDWRSYPEGTSGSHVLGFVGMNDAGGRVGRYGIEGYFEKELAGTQGFLQSEKDSGGRLIGVGQRTLEPAKDGADIVLTIDRTIEHVVCRKLEAWVEQYGAARGSVVIMDPHTGAVRAMCNAPTFDPNTYNKVDSIDVYNNTAIFDAYEPGSIFKPIVMGAALDAGIVSPSTPFLDEGEVKIGPHTIRNSDLKAHGRVSMTDVLVSSLNTGMVEIAHQLGGDTLRRYVRDFGFGQKTGIELHSESAGNIESLDRKGDIWPATASFGQGLTVTPLQIAAAYAAIANGGTLMRPYVVEEIRRPGEEAERREPEALRRVVSDKAAQQLTGMLVAVVERGHGTKAAVPGYWVAGKTGTAQIARADGGGYEQDATIGSFAGFGPVDAPKFAMVVRIDRPKDVQFAETSAAPLFGDIAAFLMEYYRVPPSRP